jgi:hypothetical protein
MIRAMSPRITALAALALVASACAPATRSAIRFPPAPLAELPRGARADFDPAGFEAVFREAVRAVRDRGFDIVACDPDLGVIATAPAEVDAPCFGTSCLVRETAAVKLGHRRARVTVTREIWDPTVRAWRVPDDRASVSGVAREERELVLRAVRERHSGALDGVCGESPCAPRSCLVAQATTAPPARE